MIFDFFNEPLILVILLGALLAAITVHEFAHAWVADYLGDATARLLGRVTLNPLAHLDPLGTIALLLFRFGWGKPVPVNSRNFRNPVFDEILVALAGPFANLAFAIFLGIILRIFPLNDLGTAVISITVQLNIVLMIFNLIPIPPLDGSRILHAILPEEIYAQFEQYGMFLLLALVFLGAPLLTELYARTVLPLTAIILGI